MMQTAIFPASTAVLVVDDNNDFLTPSGKLHGAVQPFLDEHKVLDRLNRLLAKARSGGVQVVRIPMAFATGFPEIGTTPYGIFEVVKQAGAFQAGSWGAEPSDLIVSDASDVVIRGKHSACAFATTMLQDWLELHAIDTLILTGLLSNVCVEATMRTAYDLGYRVIVASDCVAALSQAEHDAAITNNWPHFPEIADVSRLWVAIDEASGAACALT